MHTHKPIRVTVKVGVEGVEVIGMHTHPHKPVISSGRVRCVPRSNRALDLFGSTSGRRRVDIGSDRLAICPDTIPLKPVTSPSLVRFGSVRSTGRCLWFLGAGSGVGHIRNKKHMRVLI